MSSTSPPCSYLQHTCPISLNSEFGHIHVNKFENQQSPTVQKSSSRMLNIKDVKLLKCKLDSTIEKNDAKKCRRTTTKAREWI